MYIVHCGKKTVETVKTVQFACILAGKQLNVQLGCSQFAVLDCSIYVKESSP